MTMAEQATRPWTTFEHRCDRCESESWHRFSKLLEDGETILQLFFCGHHGRRFSPKLVETGWFAEDYSAGINPVPSISASVA